MLGIDRLRRWNFKLAALAVGASIMTAGLPAEANPVIIIQGDSGYSRPVPYRGSITGSSRLYHSQLREYHRSKLSPYGGAGIVYGNSLGRPVIITPQIEDSVIINPVIVSPYGSRYLYHRGYNYNTSPYYYSSPTRRVIRIGY